VGGDQLPGPTSILVNRVVPPGDKYEFITGIFGSEKMGLHTSYWQLETDRGVAIPGGSVYFIYKAV
jgi:hypothetical protein